MEYFNMPEGNRMLYEFAGSVHEHSRESQSDIGASSMSLDEEPLHDKLMRINGSQNVSALDS